MVYDSKFEFVIVKPNNQQGKVLAFKFKTANINY
jgi:hypothetical protein